MNIGHFNRLRIVSFTDHGALLDAGDRQQILMPKKYTLPSMHPGDEVEVFVYYDQSNRLVATTEQPLARVGEFAYLRVSWTNRYGAFLDWGLMKDLFVPFGEQHHRLEAGHRCWVYIYIDDRTQRIVGTTKIDRYLSDAMPDWLPGHEVDAFVWKQTELGFKLVVENQYEGLIYRNEIFSPVRVGDRLRAVVKQVRPDGKVDLMLQHMGMKPVYDFAARLLTELQEAGGMLPFSDHSDPDDVTERFQVSKKVFKKAVGQLYKDRLIVIEPDCIRLCSMKTTFPGRRKRGK